MQLNGCQEADHRIEQTLTQIEPAAVEVSGRAADRQIEQPLNQMKPAAAEMSGQATKIQKAAALEA